MNKKLGVYLFAFILGITASAVIVYLDSPRLSRDGIRILVLQGNKVVKTQDVPKGKFYFFLTHRGVFYMNTGEGDVYKLTDPSQISKEHLAVVQANVKELNSRK